MGTVYFPDMSTLAQKSWHDLRNLAIARVEWNSGLGIALSDGQSYKLGPGNFTDSHTFDPAKKITRVEVTIRKDE